MALVRFSEALSLRVTKLLEPLNDKARPNFPWLERVTLVRAPCLLLPEASCAWEPLDSSKP